MEEPEGGLSFDFEGGLETTNNPNPTAISLIQNDPNAPISSNSVAGNLPDPAAMNLQGRRSFRQTVCRHWLRSLCMKGDACGFLHQYDKSRMPVCRFFRLYGECREQDCVYKHTNEDIKECNMYKLGFCPNGPDCRYRHAKLPGPPPPVEEIFQKIQQLSSSFNQGSSNRFFQHRNTGYVPQVDKNQMQQGSAVVNQGAALKPSATVDSSGSQQQQQQIQQPQQNASPNQMQSMPNGLLNPINRVSAASPLPQGQSRYFIVKSCNRENLELSVQKGIWATQRSNESKLNEAFDSSENVVLIFSINRTRHFQGCAKMTSKIGGYVGGGGWKYAHGTAHYGRNFSLKWLKLCELSFHKTRHLRNPYNENLPVKISRDCQELEPSIGEQLASLLYLEPDSELMAIAVAAKSKREEERAKGVSPGGGDGSENPEIVPFEDNDDDEEEEEETDDDDDGSSSQPLNVGPGARGSRARPMWAPQIPFARGGVRPMPPGLRPFSPMMLGGPEAFTYGAGPPDVYRGFPPYVAPRFSGDFSALGPAPGIGYIDAAGPTGAGLMFRAPPAGAMFPGAAPGLGMMMSSTRGPAFMGGMGIAGRPSRPGPVPFRPVLPNVNGFGRGRRDQRKTESGGGGEQGKEGMGPDGVGSGGDEMRAGGPMRPYGNDESESEDEAPRRSRHGEGRKKRREPDGEGEASDHWEMPLSEQQNQ
ncbi:30-kDa cleavage and polyadenylation specificity factor 30 [Amborella trichopoda]|uniref:Uncharacterized protein n=1 Tax=Amborella trichopoda TaxID=13333 RepID=W1PCR8_AMBTC|nr:30-kDa cleavage and polyadenylation specificity factor 30 [Amborella trichopoda]ERN07697.1 hypothetical protein AMTR_s00155p00079840 [Amborella trichopoda]|eukprot:XP_006846022.1 30-kDa cleavage and polyadenylation specificity factor 30 [Amborella trichopoda]